jgi:hypothetical protein
MQQSRALRLDEDGRQHLHELRDPHPLPATASRDTPVRPGLDRRELGSARNGE